MALSTADKLYEAIQPEHSILESLIRSEAQVPAEAHLANKEPYDEADYGEWCCLYGMAYAILRREEPFLCDESLQTFAKEAANTAYRWHCTVGGKEAAERVSA